jgi:predicted extracellular nuclease
MMQIRFIIIAFVALFSAATAFAQREVPIAEIQGSKNESKLEGQSVRTIGVVTARHRNGFFIQTPDDKVDSDPNTSEGLYVFTGSRTEPPAEASVGSLVSVTGKVEEFRPRADPLTLSITEISMTSPDGLKVISKTSPLPKPSALTSDLFKSRAVDQLERFEGMRVAVDELVVVGPTGGRVDIKNASAEGSGVFFGVVKGVERPFRKPGLDLGDIMFLEQKDKDKIMAAAPKIQMFDANPERLRIDSGALLGAKELNAPSNVNIKGVTGVLHYGYRTNTILIDPEAKIEVSSSRKPVALPATTARQISIAGMNLENFFDDKDDPEIKEDVLTPEAFQRRLKKVSAAIRDYMAMPDVIGVVEAENLNALKQLAERINKDAIAAGKPDPKYDAFLVDGNDGRGIDNGFLVKTSRVQVLETKQFGKADKYKNPDTGEDNFLNDRPPLMIRVAVDDAKTGKPFEFTVVANHLKSFLGFTDPKQMANVRMKKKLQSEFLARWADERQKANPEERIMLLGDFNAFQFNDGVMDMIGTIKGKPAAKDSVLLASDDLVARDLIDLVDAIAVGQRYSYVYDGNAQVLDHIIINEPLRRHINGFGYVRVNADFPESMRNDDSRPERYSDHDPAVAYFSMDAAASPTNH